MRAKRVDYSPEVAERICAMIRAGTPEIQVCRMLGMPRSSALWHRKQR